MNEIMTGNIYQAPGADLNVPGESYTGSASIENAIKGNYEFSIRAILREAWIKTDGNKGVIWLSLLTYLGILIGIAVVLHFLGLGESDHDSKRVLGGFLRTFFTLPLTAGLLMIGVRLAAGVSAEVNDMFAYFDKILLLLGTSILMWLMILFGFLLLIIPGLYLVLAYGMASRLVVDKDLRFFGALEVSRKAVTHRWFRVAVLNLIIALIVILSFFTIIGWIWAIPMAYLAYAIMYRNMFGYGKTSGASTIPPI